ncbi:hypothetical protein VaNZ11_014708 [Volvox africanus]|uniref:Uncharacterized protein n=1 Tax=Volvox africanus TaxID=51714 RepID=A0ABQ5SJ16_9CHLO|nr:hypothetical protein VaNZ11_014708 [Volvox africanus]
MGQTLTTVPGYRPISSSASIPDNKMYFGHMNAIQRPCGRNYEGRGNGLAGILHDTSNSRSRESDVFGITYIRNIRCGASSTHFSSDVPSGAAREERMANNRAGSLTPSNIPTNLVHSPDRKHEADQQSQQVPTSSLARKPSLPLPPPAASARQGAVSKRSGRPKGSVRVRPTAASCLSVPRGVVAHSAQGKGWSLARQGCSKNSGWDHVPAAERRRSRGTDATLAHNAMMMPQSMIHTFAEPAGMTTATTMAMVMVDQSPHGLPPTLPMLPPLYNFGSLPLSGRRNWDGVVAQALTEGMDLLGTSVPTRDGIIPFMGLDRMATTLGAVDAMHGLRRSEVQASSFFQPLPYSLGSLTLDERVQWDAVIVEVLTEDLDAAHATVTLRTGTALYGGMCGAAAAAMKHVNKMEKVREPLPAPQRTYDLGSFTRSMRLCWEGIVGAVVG